MVWGNLIGIGLCVFQYYTGFIKLDPATYYIETVPVDLVFVPILLVNIGTLIGIVLMVLLPSMYISKISPVEAMRIE
jgi:lipoprotein-releasing system permease protein